MNRETGWVGGWTDEWMDECIGGRNCWL